MTTHIEPGLLRVFRFFVGFRLVLLALMALSLDGRTDDQLLLVPGPGLFWYGLLFLYLMAPATQRWFGSRFLPIGLVWATLSPIVEQGIAVRMRLGSGGTPNGALGDYWLLFFVLFVPLILVAWQYRFRAVAIYAVGTTILTGIALAPVLDRTATDSSLFGGLLFGQGVLFAFVGYVLGKLVTEQRRQRVALSEHAATVEQLAATTERARLARDLHDTLAHTLSAVAVQLEGAKSLWDFDSERARTMVDQSLATTRNGLVEARRAIEALRASPIEEHGLSEALRRLLATTAEIHGIDAASSEVETLTDLPAQIEDTLYRIAEESITNTVRHADATTLSAGLVRKNGRVTMTLNDNGHGFDASAPLPEGHHGLRGMRERIALLGGEFTVDSNTSGTTVTVVVAP